MGKVAEEPASAVSKVISCCDGIGVSSRRWVGERALESACVRIRSWRAGDMAGTHLSIVGVDFGHFD